MSNDTWNSPENTSDSSGQSSQNPAWGTSWDALGQASGTQGTGGAESTDPQTGGSRSPRVINFVPGAPDADEAGQATQIAGGPWAQQSGSAAQDTRAAQAGVSYQQPQPAQTSQPVQPASGQPGSGQSSWGSWSTGATAASSASAAASQASSQPTSQASASSPASQASASTPLSQSSASTPAAWENTGWTSTPTQQPGSQQSAWTQQPQGHQGWENTASLPAGQQWQQPTQTGPGQTSPAKPSAIGDFTAGLKPDFGSFHAPRMARIVYLGSALLAVLGWILGVVMLFRSASNIGTLADQLGSGSYGNNPFQSWHNQMLLYAILDLVLGWIPVVIAIGWFRILLEHAVAATRLAQKQLADD